MQKRPKPVSLRPISHKQKMWLYGFMILFVVVIIIGWYLTVGKIISQSFAEIQQNANKTISTAKEKVVENGNPIDEVKDATQKIKNSIAEKKVEAQKIQTAKEAVIRQLSEEIKSAQ